MIQQYAIDKRVICEPTRRFFALLSYITFCYVTGCARRWRERSEESPTSFAKLRRFAQNNMLDGDSTNVLTRFTSQ